MATKELLIKKYPSQGYLFSLPQIKQQYCEPRSLRGNKRSFKLKPIQSQTERNNSQSTSELFSDIIRSFAQGNQDNSPLGKYLQRKTTKMINPSLGSSHNRQQSYLNYLGPLKSPVNPTPRNYHINTYPEELELNTQRSKILQIRESPTPKISEIGQKRVDEQQRTIKRPLKIKQFQIGV